MLLVKVKLAIPGTDCATHVEHHLVGKGGDVIEGKIL